MGFNSKPDDKNILMKLQNSSKPDQIVYVIIDRQTGNFETQGLRELFRVKEIRVEAKDILQALPEYAEVLSFLFETMSAAEDLKLPYSYQSEFDFGGMKYTLYEEGDYRILRRAE